LAEKGEGGKRRGGRKENEAVTVGDDGHAKQGAGGVSAV